MSNRSLQSVVKRSAPIFAALGDETRLRIVARLTQEGPMSITELTTGTHVTRQAVTKHLRRMHQAGVLRMSKHGREALWELEPASIDEAQRYLREISDQWDAALGRLKRFVEER